MNKDASKMSDFIGCSVKLLVKCASTLKRVWHDLSLSCQEWSMVLPLFLSQPVATQYTNTCTSWKCGKQAAYECGANV